MASEGDVPVGLYVAAFSDPAAAREDWDGINELVERRAITVEALLLVCRSVDGVIEEREAAHAVGAGSALGAPGGCLLGLIFPPALVPATAAGSRLDGLVSHYEKRELKAEVANDLPAGSGGIIVLLDDEGWAADVLTALSRADYVSRHEVDRCCIERARSEAAALARSA